MAATVSFDVDPVDFNLGDKATERKTDKSHEEAPLDAAVIESYNFVNNMVPKADYCRSGAPLWHGWALREAFIAGTKFKS